MCLNKSETHVANYCTFKLKGTNVCWPQQNKSWLALSRNPDVIKNLFENHLVDKIKKLWCYRRLRKMTLLEFSSLFLFFKLRYSSKYFAQIYRDQYGTIMLVYLRGTPSLRPENIVNIWNLLWLSRRLIICTEQTSIYISTFPNTLTSKWAKNHEISIWFRKLRSKVYVTHRHNYEIQNVSLAWETQITTTKAKESRLERLQVDIKTLTHFTP